MCQSTHPLEQSACTGGCCFVGLAWHGLAWHMDQDVQHSRVVHLQSLLAGHPCQTQAQPARGWQSTTCRMRVLQMHMNHTARHNQVIAPGGSCSLAAMMPASPNACLQDLAATNSSLSHRVAELELALAAAGAQGSGQAPGYDGGTCAALGGSLADPLGEKAKELRKQVGHCQARARCAPLLCWWGCLGS